MKRGYLLAGLAIGGSTQAMATVAIGGQVAATTDAIIGVVDANHNVIGRSDPEMATQSATGIPGRTRGEPETLSASASSLVTYSFDGFSLGHAGAHTNVSAGWASADQGVIDLTWGFNMVNVLAQVCQANTWTPTNWSYTFTATADGAFDIAGRETTTGISTSFPDGAPSLIGLVYVSGDGSGTIGGIWDDPIGKSSLSFAIKAGQQYTFSVGNQAGVDLAPLQDLTAEGQAHLSWHIVYDTPPAPAPEPASWAMMMAGFGAVGGMMRRRKARVAFM